MEIIAVLAMEEHGGIGLDGDLPWPPNREDLEWFKSVADDSLAIMGSNTYRGFPKSIKNHVKIVITRIPELPDVMTLPPNLTMDEYRDLFETYASDLGLSKIVIMGGKRIYEMFREIVDIWYISQIEESYHSDVILDKKSLTESKVMVESIRLNGTTVVEKYISGRQCSNNINKPTNEY